MAHSTLAHIVSERALDAKTHPTAKEAAIPLRKKRTDFEQTALSLEHNAPKENGQNHLFEVYL